MLPLCCSEFHLAMQSESLQKLFEISLARRCETPLGTCEGLWCMKVQLFRDQSLFMFQASALSVLQFRARGFERFPVAGP